MSWPGQELTYSSSGTSCRLIRESEEKIRNVRESEEIWCIHDILVNSYGDFESVRDDLANAYDDLVNGYDGLVNGYDDSENVFDNLLNSCDGPANSYDVLGSGCDVLESCHDIGHELSGAWTRRSSVSGCQ